MPTAAHSDYRRARGQLAALWREDAEQVGAAAIARMARRLLVSELAAAIPNGWLARWTDTHDARAAASKLSTALSQWGAYLGPSCKPAVARVSTAMIDEGYAGMIPAGWLPKDPDDVVLIALFARYWTASQ